MGCALHAAHARVGGGGAKGGSFGGRPWGRGSMAAPGGSSRSLSSACPFLVIHSRASARSVASRSVFRVSGQKLIRSVATTTF